MYAFGRAARLLVSPSHNTLKTLALTDFTLLDLQTKRVLLVLLPESVRSKLYYDRAFLPLCSCLCESLMAIGEYRYEMCNNSLNPKDGHFHLSEDPAI